MSSILYTSICHVKKNLKIYRWLILFCSYCFVIIIGISWQVLKYFLILSYTCQASLDSSCTFQAYISRERKALHTVFTGRPATCRTNLYECCRIADVTDTLFHWWNITLCVVKGYRNDDEYMYIYIMMPGAQLYYLQL